MPTYAQLYEAIAKAGDDPVAKATAVEALLHFIRGELESPHTAADRVKNGIEMLHRFGTIDDVALLARVIARGQPLDDLGFAREVKRQLQERHYLLAEISEEEEEFLRTHTLTPENPRSKWMAVRLGRIVADAPDRVDVEAAVARKQGTRSTPYVALIVPVGEDFPGSHERR
jgi:hypothetical protein